MADIDSILEELLGDRRLRESALFSDRIYTTQPILQTGRQLQQRQEEERREERQRLDRDARKRTAHDVEGQTTRDEIRQRQRREARDERRRRHERRRLEGAATAWQQAIDENAWREDGDGKDAVPERYRQLRAMGATTLQGGGYRSLWSQRLFYEQAKFMEDFEDDYARMVEFEHYFPTYAVMDIAQLRAYFSWRTKVRRGNVKRAPVSFAFLHVYELLCGIGTTPGKQGYRDLTSFWQTFASRPEAQGTSFDSYLRRWTHDYALYHNVTDALTNATSHGDAIGVLLDAEGAILSQRGLARKAASALKATDMPSTSELFDALAHTSSYRLERSRFVKDRRSDAQAIVARVFADLVEHCARRRKTDFVEGLFGGPKEETYVMYPSAVFYDPDPPDGVVVSAGRCESYRCVRGRWTRDLAYRREEASRELGDLLRATDRCMREAYDYGHPIKLRRATPKYVQRIIDAAIAEHLSQQREAEARRITIDLAKLQDIRSAAATTREALLVDEEREESYSVVKSNIYTNMSSQDVNSKNKESFSHIDIDNKSNRCTILNVSDETAGSPHPNGALGTNEAALVWALLRGNVKEANEVASKDGRMLSVMVDEINDLLFDDIGDAAIEFVGDTPAIVADYEQDVRELVGDG